MPPNTNPIPEEDDHRDRRRDPSSPGLDDSAIDLGAMPPPPPMPTFPEIPERLRQAAEGPKASPSAAGLAGIAKGWALALDFVGTIIAAWLLGYLFDRWQNTAPWGSLIGLGLGFMSAIIRIMRHTAKQDAAEKARRGK